ncbi:MAG: ABC transporter ATP-binding protein [Spirochaetaceae bacterium]|nr:MAG: ABC transporter ATP-binding protein [Spirochaetaceae bacterium]
MTLLRMEEITKVFPGVRANDGISFDLQAGEIHALVGENGAGKTTLMKILYGLYKPDSGNIYLNDQPIAIKNPRDAINQGIGMVHQHFMLVPVFSVLENIILGRETHTAGVLQLQKPTEEIGSIMQANGLMVDLSARVEDIPVGLQQRVEILKILYRGAEILVFDEPTAVLTPQEVDELFKTFRMMKEQGKGIIFISHKLDEVLDIADRITVIRRGQVIQTLERREATKPLIAELMVGKPVLLKVDKEPPSPKQVILQVKNLTILSTHGQRVLDNINLTVRAGEIYGIAGVEGNGQTELIQAIAYKSKPETGDVLLEGQSVLNWDVRSRRERGIGHIPEDRHRFGLLLPFSLADNIVLGRHHLDPFVKGSQWIDSKKVRSYARDTIEAYDVRTPSEMTPAHALSGGNQQKAIIAREMNFEPKLLVAAQPTRGVDIGATEFVYKQLILARDRGKAVLLISADLDEILSLADRIGVIFKGAIIHEFKQGEATKEKVGLYMTGERESA